MVYFVWQHTCWIRTPYCSYKVKINKINTATFSSSTWHEICLISPSLRYFIPYGPMSSARACSSAVNKTHHLSIITGNEDGTCVAEHHSEALAAGRGTEQWQLAELVPSSGRAKCLSLSSLCWTFWICLIRQEGKKTERSIVLETDFFSRREIFVIIVCHTSFHQSETFRTISAQEATISKFRLSCLSCTKSRFFLSAWPKILTNFSFSFCSMLISRSLELIILFYVTILVLICQHNCCVSNNNNINFTFLFLNLIVLII